jgi:hypothetical protein
MSHYHILWNGTDFDWQPHKTRVAAEANAQELARRGETYLVAEINEEECDTCHSIASNNGRTVR